jgi:ABC-type dipeptide/oligopeptide/nickel transport system ATPase component
MVTRSTEDYEQHKKDCAEVIFKRYGEKYAAEFIRFYAERYDRYGRSFLDYRFAFMLLDDYKQVEQSGIRWYAIVGDGGTGKSTLAKNMGYFLDDTFDEGRVKTNVFDIVKSMREFNTVAAMKAVLLDEPDADISPISKRGQVFRSITGKARQQKLFMLYCATQLNDIPSYIFKKISGIVFTPYLRQGMFFHNNPKKKVYVIADIKRDYDKLGYGAFFKYAGTAGCLNFRTIRETPFNKEQEREYLSRKEEDYRKELDRFITMVETKYDPENNAKEVDEIIKMHRMGIPLPEIARLKGRTRPSIRHILVAHNALEKVPIINR